MVKSMLEVVLAALHARKGEWRQIAREMSPGSEDSYYSWLTKMADGRIVNPGVNTIQRLYEHLERRKS